MAQIASIVAATDFSPAADRAVRRAASLASATTGVLHLVHVLPPRELLAHFFPVPSESEVAELRKRADQALQERANRVAAQFSITPSWALFHGYAHREILAAAQVVATDVVVVGAQGQHEGVSVPETPGQTALKVAGRSTVATLLVPREAREPYHCVIACGKGAPIDGAVVGWADRLTPSNLVHLVSAYNVPYEARLIMWGASQSTIDVYVGREAEERSRQLSRTLAKTATQTASPVCCGCDGRNQLPGLTFSGTMVKSKSHRDIASTVLLRPHMTRVVRNRTTRASCVTVIVAS